MLPHIFPIIAFRIWRTICFIPRKYQAMAVTLSISYLPIFPLTLVTNGEIYLVFILGFYPVFCLVSDQDPSPPLYLSGWLDSALKKHKYIRKLGADLG